jgi:hypothetical protein
VATYIRATCAGTAVSPLWTAVSVLAKFLSLPAASAGFVATTTLVRIHPNWDRFMELTLKTPGFLAQ